MQADSHIPAHEPCLLVTHLSNEGGNCAMKLSRSQNEVSCNHSSVRSTHFQVSFNQFFPNICWKKTRQVTSGCHTPESLTAFPPQERNDLLPVASYNLNLVRICETEMVCYISQNDFRGTARNSTIWWSLFGLSAV